MAADNASLERKVNSLERKIDSVAQRQDEVVIEGIKSINEQMKNFAYVSQKEYAEDRMAEDERYKALEERLKNIESKTNAGGLDTLNKVFSNGTKILLGALSLGLIIVIVLTLANTVPAIQSALGSVK